MAEFSQEVTVRVWRNDHVLKILKTGRFGHASVALKGSLVGEEKIYISWWPSRGAGKGNLKERQPGHASASVGDDASSEISEGTQMALESGRYAPRGNQYVVLEDENGRIFGVHADEKIRLPGFGSQGVYFGLSTPRIKMWWDQWQKSGKYTMLSNKENCSGVAATALEQGGAAIYATPPKAMIWMLPNEVADWARQIRRALDNLNDGMRQLVDAYNASPAGQRGGPTIGRHRTGGVETLWTPQEWKAESNKGLPVRSGLLQKIDKAVEKCHESRQAGPFERIAAAAALAKALIEFHQSKPDSQRSQPILQLANQLATVLTPRATQQT
jgi:hypothetical protein